MKNLTEQYNDLTEKIEFAKQMSNKAHGAVEQLLSQLKAEFNINSLEEGEEQVKKINKEIKDKEKIIEQKLNEFQKKWKDVLNDF